MDNVIVQANDYIYHSKIAHLPVKSGDLVELISREGYITTVLGTICADDANCIIIRYGVCVLDILHTPREE